MKIIQGERRFKDTLPTIGIRPTIDGRMEGVRESLEDQTMGLAKAVAGIISTSLHHPNGESVKCVIPSFTIGGVAEAEACAELFRKENVCASITVTPCWCYGTETMDMTPLIPKAILGFNGTERPGAVYLAAVLAAHAQKGFPAFGIYGRNVQDADDMSIPKDVKEKLLRFSKAALAVGWMKNKSYLSIGGVSMGIAGSIVDNSFFQDYLGMRNEQVDMTEVLRRLNLGIHDPDEFSKAMAWVKDNCIEGKDYNPEDKQKTRDEKQKDWETVVKMALIVRDLMVGNDRLAELGWKEEALGHDAIISGFQGQRNWTDFMPNADFLETILNSSFDWNGIRQPYLVATENDSLNGVSMLFSHLLTGTAQIFVDVRTYWSPEAVKRVTGKDLVGVAKNGILHLINSGSACLDGTGKQRENGKPVMKPFWEIKENEVEECLKATRFHAAIYEYFRGGGFSTSYTSESDMPMTMSRINLIKGLGPVLQIAEGFSVGLDDDINEILIERTNPTWPTTWFAPRLTGNGSFKDVYTLMNNWGVNHAAVSYGHIGAELITLASMLRIPVSMHNVPESKIFRPVVWNSFGTNDPEGADYRACKNFGPLYKN
ncbi:MAG: L-fucose isomerase [Promethearchaeota archaeon]